MRQRIRNFCIVAHIDHGKSTLADRLIEATGTLDKRQMRDQVLDSMDLERERGITIKLNACRMGYRGRDGLEYELNLIDTPGHVDFTYEVSRSLAACEGAVLVVDASQGVQAQTLSNLFLAMEAGLEIVPVLNKIDLPGAEPERRAAELVELLGVAREDVLAVSAKEGTGIPDLLEAIVAKVPAPRGKPDSPLRALVFDSYYDRYRGAVPSVRVVDGTITKGTQIIFGAHRSDVYEVTEVGYPALGQHRTDRLEAGEVGYVVASIRGVRDARVGDTILDHTNPASELLAGYRDVQSMVFAGVYPTTTDQYEDLRDALEKLQVNDASLRYEPESSQALGFGFRCGFLGLLHMDIVRERLEREYDLDLLATTPNVKYVVTLANGDEIVVHSPTDLPDPGSIAEISEPYIRASLICPKEYVGAVMELCQARRGTHVDMHYLSPERVQIRYDLPLGEIVLDFYDVLKSSTKGYASFDYEPLSNRPGDLVKLDVLLAGEPVDALSIICHRDKAYEQGKELVSRLRKTIPRQQFDVPVQAAVGSRILARETVKAVRKDVTAKLYGGDVTRKRKLLEKQKKGKKRMKQVGSVEVPQEAFLAVLTLGDDD